MDRPKRPFFSLKTQTKDEQPQDDVRPKKSKNKVGDLEKTNKTRDDEDAGKFLNSCR